MKNFKFKLLLNNKVHELTIASTCIISAINTLFDSRYPEKSIKSISITEEKATAKVKEKWVALSPDGITIDFDVFTYPSEQAAYEAIDKWIPRFKTQGYYRDNRLRKIELKHLKAECTVKQV